MPLCGTNIRNSSYRHFEQTWEIHLFSFYRFLSRYSPSKWHFENNTPHYSFLIINYSLSRENKKSPPTKKRAFSYFGLKGPVNLMKPLDFNFALQILFNSVQVKSHLVMLSTMFTYKYLVFAMLVSLIQFVYYQNMFILLNT